MNININCDNENKRANITNNINKSKQGEEKMDTIYESAILHSLDDSKINYNFSENLHNFQNDKSEDEEEKSNIMSIDTKKIHSKTFEIKFDKMIDIDLNFFRKNMKQINIKVSKIFIEIVFIE